jgi:hypothetical protein
MSITYSSVASRDSVCLAFLVVALNDLDVLAYDVGIRTYLNAACRENVCFVAGSEVGSRQGMVVKIIRAIYGFKSSGAAWRATLNSTLMEMDFDQLSLTLTLTYKRMQSHAGLRIMSIYW